METKGITCKIPLDLHNRVSEEIRETESTISKFIEMVIMEYYEKGAVKVMEKGRTLAFQVSEELFQRVKEYLENYEKTYHRRLTQKEFVISLIEQALEEAEEEFEAARAAQEEARAKRMMRTSCRKAGNRTMTRMTRKKKPSLPMNPLKTKKPCRMTIPWKPAKPMKMKKPTHKAASNSPQETAGCFHIDFISRKRGDVH